MSIRANIIYPGLVDTPLGRHTSAGRPSRSAAGVPFGRMATGWEIAYAALFSSPTKAFTSTRRRWRSTAESPGFEPKSGEKISFAAGAIAAINPLPIGLRTKRALLFSEGYRLLRLTRPSSLCASAPRRIWKMKRCDRFVHFCATPRPGSDAGWPRSSPSPPPACRPPALKARPLLRHQANSASA